VLLIYGYGAARLLGSVWFTGFISVGMVTGVFAVLERTLPASLLEEWNPRKLRLLLDAAQSALFCWFLTAKVVTGVAITGTSAQRSGEMAAAVDVWMARMQPLGVILAVVVMWVDGYRIYRAKRADQGLRLQPVKAR
jgi:hypothetical protein